MFSSKVENVSVDGHTLSCWCSDICVTQTQTGEDLGVQELLTHTPFIPIKCGSDIIFALYTPSYPKTGETFPTNQQLSVNNTIAAWMYHSQSSSLPVCDPALAFVISELSK